MTAHITRISEDAHGWFARCRICTDFTPPHRRTAANAQDDATEHKRLSVDTCSIEHCEGRAEIAFLVRRPSGFRRKSAPDRMYATVDFNPKEAPSTMPRYCAAHGRELIRSLLEFVPHE